MTTIKLRRGTAAAWTARNTVLADGERGVEKDTGREKSGDGVTPWNDLPYFMEAHLLASIDAEVGTLVPSASTSAQGKVELATSAETLAGTDAVRAVTPAGAAASFVVIAPAPSGDTSGATDTAAIAALLANTSVARTITVLFQRGTYWLALDATTTSNGPWSLALPAAGGIELAGQGMGVTTLKLAANQGNYRAMFQATGDVGFLNVHDLTIDHNEQNNSSHLLQSQISTVGRVTININKHGGGTSVGATKGVHYERVEVKNFDSVNCFTLHGDSGSGIGPVVVRDCLFVPAAITGSHDHDHSTIYWQEPVTPNYAGCIVDGNRFLPATTGLNTLGAAIECHGSHYWIKNNTILNYPTGMQATAVSFSTTEQVRVKDNTLRGVSQGIVVVVAGITPFTSGVGLHDMKIQGNQIIVDRDQWWTKTNGLFAQLGAGILFNGPGSAFEVQNVDIDHNQVRFLAVSSITGPTDTGLHVGIVYYRPGGGTDRRIRVRGNLIEGALSYGMYLRWGTAYTCGTDGNTIIDPLSLSNTNGDSGIGLFHSVSATDCSYRNDQIIDTRATTKLTYGINAFTGNPVTNCDITDVRVHSVLGSQVPSTTQGSTAGTNYLSKYRQSGAPFTNARYGSEVTDDATGKVYAQTASPGGAVWNTTKATQLTNTAGLDFPNITAGASAELTLTVTAAAVGDAVLLGPPATIEAGLTWAGYVSATNTVTIRVTNPTAAAINPASATWRATIIR